MNSPPPEAVRLQLQSILAAPCFANAARARRFLIYIVEETLAGRTEGIKELVLGPEVFDRPADFDPKVDPVVRVEAGRLRKRLDDYYALTGAADPVLIEVAVGSYVPRFQFRAPHSGPPAAASRLRYAPALLILVVIAVSGVWWGIAALRRPTRQPTPSIAVLPFLNLSPDPANDYFSDGLTEELTDALCNAGGLRVASRTSAFFFKGRQADVHEIARKLHVGFVVEGSVRRQIDRIKITVQLIRSDDGFHVLSRSFERQLSDVFALQQEIAVAVVDVLRVKLGNGENRRFPRTHAVDPRALDLYLQGKHYLNSFEPGSAERAEVLFNQAAAADPNYPMPYIGLAGVYGLMNLHGAHSPGELFALASTAVHKALSLDEDLADGHAILGIITARYDYDWAAGERHLRRALQLNPSFALAHFNLAQNILAPQQRWKEADAENALARELDPLSPMVAVGEPFLASLERRTDAAVAGFRSLASASPRNLMAMGGLAVALSDRGDLMGALSVSEQMQKAAPSAQTLAAIGTLKARSGDVTGARAILEQLKERARDHHVSPSSFALLYVALGDTDAVFRELELAREQRESSIAFLRSASAWDPVRGDPRFSKLLGEVGLSDWQIQNNQ